MPHLPASVLSDSKEQHIEMAFPASNAESSDQDLKDATQPPEFTFKHVVVLISLTLLFVSAVAPFYLILSSLSMPISLPSHVSLHRSRPWRRRGGILAGHVEYVGHCCCNTIRRCDQRLDRTTMGRPLWTHFHNRGTAHSWACGNDGRGHWRKCNRGRWFRARRDDWVCWIARDDSG